MDWIWSAAFAALVTYLASAARRGPLLFGALTAALFAQSPLGIAAAMTAVVAGTASTRQLHRRAPLARGLAGGATAVSLLSTGVHRSGITTAIAIVGALTPVFVSGLRQLDARRRRNVIRSLAVVAFVSAAAAGAAGIGAALSARRIDHGATSFQLGLAAARQGRIDVAGAHLAGADVSLSGAQRTVDRWGAIGRLVPGVSQHVRSVSGVIREVRDVSGQAVRTAGIAESAQLGLRVGRTDLDAITALTNPFRRLATALEEVVVEARAGLGSPLIAPLDSRLRRVERDALHALEDARSAQMAVEEVPEILGATAPRRYLLLFTSPAEARGRFGFPGSFAEMTIDEGQLRLGEHGTTSALLAGTAPAQAAFDLDDDRVRPYVPFGATRLMLSATIPPDFPTVASLAATLWEESGRAPLDGVLRFDPASLAALLQFTGPVEVAGVPEPLTSENLEAFLITGQYVQFPDEQAPRREVLETVATTTVERLEKGDLPGPRALVNVFGPLAAQNRLNMAMFDRGATRLTERLGMSGALDPPTTVDSLFVTNVNSGGNKIDAFLHRHVEYDASYVDGELKGTIRVLLTNDAPAADLPFYVIGSSTRPPLPKGTNRTTLLVYTSGEVDRAIVDGAPAQVRTERTAGRWLHEIALDIPPGHTADIELELVPSSPASASDEYVLELEPGGGTFPDTYAVRVATKREDPVTFSGSVSQTMRVADATR